MLWPPNASLVVLVLGLAVPIDHHRSALKSQISGPQLTVYNEGFAFVKDIRKFAFHRGRQTVSVSDVPRMIDTTSVSIKGLVGPAFSVLEQNYQYDLISPVAILEKSVGGRIRLQRHFGDKTETVDGKLLYAPSRLTSPDIQGNQNYSGMVIRTDTGQVILDPTGEVTLKSVPNGLISKPTLKWDLESGRAGKATVELSYMTKGMIWSTDYVLTIDEKTPVAGLSGWVTLTNQCGKSFVNSPLKLLAGEVNMAPREMREMSAFSADAAPAALAAPSFGEQSFFEYHLYTLNRLATIRNNETKQLSLLNSSRVHYQKKLIIDPYERAEIYVPMASDAFGAETARAKVWLEFQNTKVNGLGIPLPKGKVRVYQRDADGSAQFVGEDNIQHTPRNESLRLLVGEAFDVVADRKRTSYSGEFKSATETFSIEVRNRKTVTTSVDLVERHYYNWKITNNSEPFEKTDSTTAVAHLKLGPNETRTVTLTVTTTW